METELNINNLFKKDHYDFFGGGQPDDGSQRCVRNTAYSKEIIMNQSKQLTGVIII